MQRARRPFSLALAKLGSNKPARTAMMAMTTKSSIRVKAEPQEAIGHRFFDAARFKGNCSCLGFISLEFRLMRVGVKHGFWAFGRVENADSHQTLMKPTTRTLATACAMMWGVCVGLGTPPDGLQTV